MKKTILVCILVSTLLLGCGNKKVDYDMPTGESNNIPAWELGFCTINAIDGTLIN